MTSATEVGALLAQLHDGANVSYFATVYRDGRGEVRNHIAAALRVGADDQIVDATWKQFPHLQSLQIGDPGGGWKQEALVKVFSPAAWQALIAEHTPGITDVELARLATADEAREWMRNARRDLLNVALPPAAGKQKSGGCTLF